jgi:hypothetical protein
MHRYGDGVKAGYGKAGIDGASKRKIRSENTLKGAFVYLSSRLLLVSYFFLVF